MAKDNSFLGNEDDNAKIASGLGAKGNSRVQAAEGAAGTTTGDSSGTGVNASKRKKKRKPVLSVGTPGGERLGDARRNDPQVQAKDQISRIERTLRRSGRGSGISARAAFTAINNINKNLNTTEVAREATEARTKTAADRLLFDASNSEANRDSTRALQTERLGSDERLTGNRIASQERIGNLNRGQSENAALRRDALLQKQSDISQTRADTTAANAKATALRGEESLEIQRQQLGFKQIEAGRDQSNLDITRDIAREGAEADIATSNVESQLKSRQLDKDIGSVRAKLANNQNISGDELTRLVASAEASLDEAQRPVSLGATATPDLTAAEIDNLPPDQKRAYINSKVAQYNLNR